MRSWMRSVGLWLAAALSVSGSRTAAAGDEVPGETRTRVLFLFDSVRGLHLYDPVGQRFAALGPLRSDRLEENVRALYFAVRGRDRAIFVADGQQFDSPLYVLDPAAWRLTRVGRTPGCLCTSLSFNPKNGLLYGVLWPEAHGDFLAILDPQSGGFHRIAPIVTGAKIAFAPDGVLYAMISGGYLDPGVEKGQLYQIDVATGKHTLLGKAKLDYDSTCFTIAADGTGYLLEHTGGLLTVDLRTGNSRRLKASPCRSAFGLFEYEVEDRLLRAILEELGVGEAKGGETPAKKALPEAGAVDGR